MAAFSPPRFFAAWRVEATGFPFRWALHIVFYLTRSVIVHDAASCSREDSLYECGRPCDALSCLFFSALWLRCNLSVLVQVSISCFKTFPITAVTCLQVRPMFLDLLLDPCARSDFPNLRCLLKFPAANINKVLFPATTRYRQSCYRKTREDDAGYLYLFRTLAGTESRQRWRFCPLHTWSNHVGPRVHFEVSPRRAHTPALCLLESPAPSGTV